MAEGCDVHSSLVANQGPFAAAEGAYQTAEAFQGYSAVVETGKVSPRAQVGQAVVQEVDCRSEAVANGRESAVHRFDDRTRWWTVLEE